MAHSAHGDSGASTSGGAASTAGVDHGMIPYLHFTGGDFIYFSAWEPSSAGAIAGACIGLFFFALFERWFASLRGAVELHWKHRALLLSATYAGRPGVVDLSQPTSRADASSTGKEKELESAAAPIPPLMPRMRPRTIPPFVASQDIPRGIMYGFHMFLGYLLMLAVMTYNAGIIIAIVVGLGVGEMIFGRVSASSGH